jgi:hypothetical protein
MAREASPDRWWHKRSVVALLAGLAAGATCAAQATPGTVYVAVADADGRPVSGLTEKDFVVNVDNVTQPLIGVQPASEPLSIVLIAGSVVENDLQQERIALQSVINRLRQASPDSRVGLIDTDASAVPVLVGLTEAASGLDRRAARLQRTGEFDLVEGFLDATRALAREPNHRRDVLVISSGGLGSPRADLQRVAQAFKDTRAALWEVHFESHNAGACGNPLAVLTGGRCETIFDSLALDATAKRVTDLLLSQYALTYAPTRTAGPGALQVAVRRAGVKVLAPVWVGQ